MPPRTDLINATRAADILGVTRQAVEKMTDVLPPRVVGKRRYYLKSDVDRLAGERDAAIRAKGDPR